MKMTAIHTRFMLLSCLFAGYLATAQNYPSQEQFGKNRVQYSRFEWKIIRTTNFEIYHYGAGTPLATLTAQYAETEFDRITEALGYTPYNRIKIFLYNSPQELMQSNMGMATLSNLNEKEIDLAKSRVEIAFTGDQISFRKQLVREVSQLFIYDMLYGGSLKDALQSSLLLSLPDWFMSGISAYIAEGWSSELDDYMRDAVLRKPTKRLSLLTGKEATVYGQSVWNYIAERYGKDNISNILNLTRIIRTEQTSISSTLGVSYSRFLKDWRDFYMGMATNVNTTYKDVSGDWRQEIKQSESSFPSRVRLSTDNQFVAVTTNDKDQYSVDIINTANQNRTHIVKGKHAVSKRTYVSRTPLIAWQRGGGLAVITDQNDEIILQIFDINEKGKVKERIYREIRGLNQVSDFDISNDGSTLVLSADSRGQNDIYLFNVGRASALPLTNDLYDDTSPRFVGGSSSRVLFVSNRLTDSTADKGTYKTIKEKSALYLHDGNPRSLRFQRIIDSVGTILSARSADENTYYFFADRRGITNLYKFEANSKSLNALTSFDQSIRDGDYSISSGSLVSTNLQGGQELVTYQAKIAPTSTELAPTQRMQNVLGATIYKSERKTNNPVADAKMIAQMANPRRMVLDSGEIDTDNYEFDADVLRTFEGRQRRGTGLTTQSINPIRNRKRDNIAIKGPFDYKSMFISSDATSEWRVDPVRQFGFAQSLTMNDLLENHIVRAGFFLATNLRTNDLWAEYQNLSHRIDYGVRVDRRSLFVSERGFTQKYRYNRIGVTVAYPLSVNARVSLNPFFAQSRLLDVNSISSPDVSSNYIGARAEFVYDNTKINGMNMMEGTRFKVRYDLFGGISGTAGFNRLAVDLRHYQKIHRDIIFAARISMAHSGGASPKKSALGGMENWTSNNRDVRSIDDPLNVGLNSQTALPIDNRDIFFVELATNLRGFNINKVSGTSHLLFNGELRMPLVKYFYRGPITSNFLRNFQLVGFTDVGTAWSGKGPFSRQNSINTEFVPGDFFQATVNNFRNPFLLGYGLGARTILFGFYVKFDYAWGLDNGEIKNPIPYLTLGYDF
jgi:hypothetical protein